MNRRSIFLIAAVLFAAISLATGIIFVSAQTPKDPDAPVQPDVTLGQPGLSYRYVKTFGVTGQPYIADSIHVNRPHGLFIDGNNNVYVVERGGNRLLRFNSTGVSTLVIGKA